MSVHLLSFYSKLKHLAFSQQQINSNEFYIAYYCCFREKFRFSSENLNNVTQYEEKQHNFTSIPSKWEVNSVITLSQTVVFTFTATFTYIETRVSLSLFTYYGIWWLFKILHPLLLLLLLLIILNTVLRHCVMCTSLLPSCRPFHCTKYAHLQCHAMFLNYTIHSKQCEMNPFEWSESR